MNKDFIIIAEDLKHNARNNTRAQLSAVNNAIQVLVLQQKELLDKFSLRDED